MPTITWSKPADILYGTALSSTQLNATAPMSGTLTYSSPSGTVLSAGASQALQVTFTPADTVDYATVSDTVSINVNHLAVTSLTPTPNGDGTPRDERARTKG